jgi:hypothetical protein
VQFPIKPEYVKIYNKDGKCHLTFAPLPSAAAFYHMNKAAERDEEARQAKLRTRPKYSPNR